MRTNVVLIIVSRDFCRCGRLYVLSYPRDPPPFAVVRPVVSLPPCLLCAFVVESERVLLLTASGLVRHLVVWRHCHSWRHYVVRRTRGITYRRTGLQTQWYCRLKSAAMSTLNIVVYSRTYARRTVDCRSYQSPENGVFCCIVLFAWTVPKTIL